MQLYVNCKIASASPKDTGDDVHNHQKKTMKKKIQMKKEQKNSMSTSAFWNINIIIKLCLMIFYETISYILVHS